MIINYTDINGDTMTITPDMLLKAVSVASPANIEFDKAAAEIRKCAKTRFDKLHNGGKYRITGWDGTPTSGDELASLIKSRYSKSLSEKIVDLLEGASMAFSVSHCTTRSQFERFWSNYFRQLVH